MQGIAADPDHYVEDRVGLWMRVDGPRGAEPLAFDNMENRPISGTRDWQRYDVVLDVPSHARAIAARVLLVGRGEVAMADFGLEIVGDEVPTTDLYETSPEGPRNLDFSETSDGDGSRRYLEGGSGPDRTGAASSAARGLSRQPRCPVSLRIAPVRGHQSRSPLSGAPAAIAR